jgi:hypothetical protein
LIQTTQVLLKRMISSMSSSKMLEAFRQVSWCSLWICSQLVLMMSLTMTISWKYCINLEICLSKIHRSTICLNHSNSSTRTIHLSSNMRPFLDNRPYPNRTKILLWVNMLKSCKNWGNHLFKKWTQSKKN